MYLCKYVEQTEFELEYCFHDKLLASYYAIINITQISPKINKNHQNKITKNWVTFNTMAFHFLIERQVLQASNGIKILN